MIPGGQKGRADLHPAHHDNDGVTGNANRQLHFLRYRCRKRIRPFTQKRGVADRRHVRGRGDSAKEDQAAELAGGGRQARSALILRRRRLAAVRPGWRANRARNGHATNGKEIIRRILLPHFQRLHFQCVCRKRQQSGTENTEQQAGNEFMVNGR
jgi:hypothetical protein